MIDVSFGRQSTGGRRETLAYIGPVESENGVIYVLSRMVPPACPERTKKELFCVFISLLLNKLCAI